MEKPNKNKKPQYIVGKDDYFKLQQDAEYYEDYIKKEQKNALSQVILNNVMLRKALKNVE